MCSPRQCGPAPLLAELRLEDVSAECEVDVESASGAEDGLPQCVRGLRTQVSHGQTLWIHIPSQKLIGPSKPT